MINQQKVRNLLLKISDYVEQTNRPINPKIYQGWKRLNNDDEVLAIMGFVPFREILNLYDDLPINAQHLPNKCTWFTFGFSKECKDAQSLQSCVPSLDETFIPNPGHINLLLDVINGINKPGYGRGYYGYGEAGTGKTSTAHWLFAILRMGIVQINCKSNMEVEEMFISHTCHDGIWTTSKGPIIKAIEMNCPLVIDEMDLAPSEFIPALNNLIEGRKFSVPFYEDGMLQAGDLFKIIGFGNTSGSGCEIGNYNGRSQLDASSLDRMYKDYYDPLTKEQFFKIAKSHYFNFDDELLDKIATLCTQINDSVRQGNLPEMISPRGLLGILYQIEQNKDVVKNSIMYAVGHILSSLCENREYRQIFLTLYSTIMTEGAQDVNAVESMWEQRAQILKGESDDTSA